MATTTILHVGDDLCQRIPVMQTAGFIVFQSECSIPAIHQAFEREDSFSAVIFHSDISAPPEPALRETRALSPAPFVLFQNPTVVCDNEPFDLIIPALTPPDIWLEKLREIVQAARELCERSQQLRLDCAALRSQSQAIRATSIRNRVSPIDPDALWRGDSDGKPPQESSPRNNREKAG